MAIHALIRSARQGSLPEFPRRKTGSVAEGLHRLHPKTPVGLGIAGFGQLTTCTTDAPATLQLLGEASFKLVMTFS